VNKTKFLRPRPRPEQQDQDQSLQDQDQDQDQSYKTKTGLYYHGCSYNTRTAHHQNGFLSVKTAVLNTLIAWQYNFNYQFNGTACMFTENKYTTHFATRKNAQSQLVTVQFSLSKCQPEKSKV